MSIDNPMKQDNNAGVLATEFVTPQQTETLTKLLELALEELNHVVGGAVRLCSAPPDPSCRTCTCNCRKP